MVHPQDEVGEAEAAQNIRAGGEQLHLDDRGTGANGIDVALIELAESSARGTIGTPHRLNLIALEEPRKLAAMFRHHARERHGQVVAKREIGFARRLVLTAAQHFENELRALFPVLARQGLDVLECWRLQRFESVTLVHLLHHRDHVAPSANVGRQKIAHAARRTAWGSHYRQHTERKKEGGRRKTLPTFLPSDSRCRAARDRSCSVMDRSNTSASRRGTSPSSPGSSRSPACPAAG